MDGQRLGHHTVSRLTVHIVWATKYRYPVLVGELKPRCRALLIQICKAEDVKIVGGVISKDHVHMHVEYPPRLSVSDLVKRMKGRTLDCTQEGGQGVKSYLGLMILGRKLSRGQVPQTGVQPPFVVQRNECPNTLTGFVQISVFL